MHRTYCECTHRYRTYRTVRIARARTAVKHASHR
jgi:hypothetical protein